MMRWFNKTAKEVLAGYKKCTKCGNVVDEEGIGEGGICTSCQEDKQEYQDHGAWASNKEEERAG